jgi:gluconolactonase
MEQRMRQIELTEITVLADGLSTPEGPVALADGSVIFVEVRGQRISRVDAEGNVKVVADLPGAPSGAARAPDGSIIVANCGPGLMRAEGASEEEIAASGLTASIQRVDLESGEFECLYTESDGKPLQGPNDLVFDKTGNFWLTDCFTGIIHYAAADGSSIVPVIEGVAFPNGIGLSPSGDTLYWTQTFTRQVMKRRVSAPGEIVPSIGYDYRSMAIHKRVDPEALLVGLPGGAALDGFAVEENGALCLATLVEGGVHVIAPDGTVEAKFVFPKGFDEGMVTNMAFGGTDMQTAYLTCETTGRVISCRWPRPGLRIEFQE